MFTILSGVDQVMMEVLMPVSTWLLLVTMIMLWCYWYYVLPMSRLKSVGINGPVPRLITGNMKEIKEEGFWQMDMRYTKEYGPIYSLYEGRRPTIIVSDVDVVKQVLVKQFNNFRDRRDFYFNGPFSKGLFNSGGDYWSFLRTLLSPTFSSSKLKQMISAINECSETLLRQLDIAVEKNEHVEIKEYMGAYTMDVIAATAFGLKINSQADRKNPFVFNIQKVTQLKFHPLMLIVGFVPFLIPLIEPLGFSYIPRGVIKFFNDVTREAVEVRKKTTMKRVDFLQLMMNAHTDGTIHGKGRQSRELKTDELMAQAILFFAAGYDTTSSTLSFFLYSMAVNPHCQEKLIQEVDTILPNSTEPTYQNVQELNYMDMCLSETLRLYPIITRVDRKAENDIDLKGLRIPRGTIVQIAIYVLHHNPEVWPNPEQFDSQRFTAKAKETRNPYSYLPFGQGPRQCIGMRLAQLEMKMVLAKIFQTFTFSTCDKTQKPLNIGKRITLSPQDGVWLKIVRREQ